MAEDGRKSERPKKAVEFPLTGSKKKKILIRFFPETSRE